MAIPITINKAATQYASSHGGGVEIYNAFIEGWQAAQREKKAKVKEATLAMDDEYTFERWWKLYGISKSKDKCMAKWVKMTYDERKLAVERTPAYVTSTPDIRYRKNPLTWLNQRCWNDEIYTQLPAQLIEADAEKFMAYFNNLFEGTDIPMLTEMTESRKRQLNIIYTLHQKDILAVLDKVRDSSRLTTKDEHGRRYSFEFIFTEENFLRIKEGYFDD